MAVKNFVLMDTQQAVLADDCQIGPQDVGGTAKGYAVRKTTLRGGKRHGVEMVEVDNGTCRFVVLPTRGMNIWKAWLGDVELGWKSPVAGPIHPSFVDVGEPSGLGWLDGFDELLCRCGLENNGAPDFDPQTHQLRLPLHGRISNLPAHRLELNIDGDTGEISLVGTVDETRFHFQKLRLTSRISTRVGEPGFRIVDEVTNLAGVPGEMQLLYHINFGPPILEAGAQIVAPVKEMVPRTDHAAAANSSWDRYSAPQPAFAEQVYFFNLLADAAGQTQVLLQNAQGKAGVSLHWPTGQLPCFTLWKNTASERDGYVTGLEPGTNFPNPKSHESTQGRVIKLAPGETRTFEVAITGHTTAEQVAAAKRRIAAIQGEHPPKIFATPQAGWVPE
jgi:galactose mutarotase-like enzyme